MQNGGGDSSADESFLHAWFFYRLSSASIASLR